jgi:uncharacterized protein YigA (DUF484 family)
MAEDTRKVLKEVLARVERWPEERQHDAVQVLLEMERQDETAVRLTPEQVEEVRRIRRAIRDGRGVFAADQEMAELWKSFGL